MNKEGFINEVRELVAKNEVSEAINALKRLFEDVKAEELLGDVIILNGRFRENERKKHSNTISNENYNIESNRINSSILNLVNKIHELEDVSSTKLERYFEEVKTFPRSYFYQLLTIMVFGSIVSYILIDRKISDLQNELQVIKKERDEYEIERDNLLDISRNTRLNPLVVSMDSPNLAKDNVYDYDSRREGKTNSDDIEEALKGSNILLMKEVTGPDWNRIEHIKKFNPDLLLIHYSCFYSNSSEDEQKEFDAFLSRIEKFNTKLLIYSRQKEFRDKDLFDIWKFKKVKKYPNLKGKLFAFHDLDRLRDERRPKLGAFYSFRHATTRDYLKNRIEELLSK